MNNHFNYENNPNKQINIPENNSSKKGKNIKALIIIIILLAVGTFLIIKFCFHKEVSDVTLESTSFFVANKENKYALFNEDGKQLTDFKFLSRRSLINGSTVVTNDKEEQAIISSSGKIIVNFGTYESIYQRNSFFDVKDKNSKKFLLNSSGKKITSLENTTLTTFSGEYNYALLKTEKEYTVIDHNGKTITKFANVNNDDIKSPSASSDNKYVSIFYNNKNYIINIHSKKLILSFEANDLYCINGVNSNNPDEVILRTCDSNNSTQYKVVRNEKIVYEKSNSACQRMYYNSDNIICEGDEKTVLNNQGKPTVDIFEAAYKDYKTYAQEKKEGLTSVDIYENGNISKNIPCRTLRKHGYIAQGIYVLEAYESKLCNTTSRSYQYYKSDGSILTNDVYEIANLFDESDNAIVSKDWTNYYLINNKGKKISKDYSDITNISKGYYRGINGDKTYSIINKKGEEIYIVKDYNIQEHNKIYYLVINDDSEYVIYNLTAGKELVKLTSKPKFENDYFITTENNKTQLYSYKNGKQFYEL